MVAILIVVIISLFANYYDTARVTTGHERKLVIETYASSEFLRD